MVTNPRLSSASRPASCPGHCEYLCCKFSPTTSNTFLTHFRYLPHLDIWGNIFDELSPVDVIHFGQINKAARIAVTNYSQLNFDIKRMLSPYFSEEDIKSFRLVQLITGAVISGSTAVQFFDRTTYPGSDLDIYVEHQYCRDVAYWLVSRGYEYKPSKPDQPKSFVEAFKSWN